MGAPVPEDKCAQTVGIEHSSGFPGGIPPNSVSYPEPYFKVILS